MIKTFHIPCPMVTRAFASVSARSNTCLHDFHMSWKFHEKYTGVYWSKLSTFHGNMRASLSARKQHLLVLPRLSHVLKVPWKVHTLVLCVDQNLYIPRYGNTYTCLGAYKQPLKCAAMTFKCLESSTISVSIYVNICVKLNSPCYMAKHVRKIKATVANAATQWLSHVLKVSR